MKTVNKITYLMFHELIPMWELEVKKNNNIVDGHITALEEYIEMNSWHKARTLAGKQELGHVIRSSICNWTKSKSIDVPKPHDVIKMEDHMSSKLECKS